jgi:cytidylate kinase
MKERETRPSKFPPKDIICVSGDYKAGKTKFSSRLASATNLEHFSMRTLKNVHDNYVDWDKILKEKDNRKIDEEIVNLAQKKSCILDFRFSALLCSIHNIPYVGIWITAPLDIRTERISLFWGKSKSETRTLMQEREEKELHICETLYGRTFRDQRLYHILVDTSECFLPVSVPFDTTSLVVEYVPEITKRLTHLRERLPTLS